MTQTRRSTDLIDARPMVAATVASAWAQAETTRDALALAIEKTARSFGARVLVSKSQPGVYPVWVRMAAWWPVDEDQAATVTKRHELSVVVDANPYLTHPIEFQVRVLSKNRVHEFRHWTLHASELAALVAYALEQGPKPDILRDAARRLAWAGLPIFSFFVPQNRLIAAARPRRLTGPNLLGAGGAAVAAIGGLIGSTGPASLATLGVFVGVCMLLGAGYWANSRPHVYSLIKRPETAPRYLFMVDTWHTSVPGVGAVFDELLQRMERAVSGLDTSITQAWETHQYRTPYGFEERDRITLTKGQAVVHLHLYRFTDDAFIGWDGFLNWSRWAETQPVSVSIQDGKRVEYRSLSVASYTPTEFDLVELSALTELVHRRIVMELKAFLSERAIEADFDFTIIRGNRDHALTAGKGGAGSGQAPRRTWRDAINQARPAAKD